MALMSPGAVAHADDDNADDDGASMSIPSPSSASANTTSSPGLFLSLSDQTFTPLSMDCSDLDLVDDTAEKVDAHAHAHAHGSAAKPKQAGTACMALLQDAHDAHEAGNHHLHVGPKSSSTDGARGIAGSRVQSPGPLGATVEEYDLVSTSNIVNSESAENQSRSSPPLPAEALETTSRQDQHSRDAGLVTAGRRQIEPRDNLAVHPHRPLLQALHATPGPQQPSSPPSTVHDSKLNSALDLIHSADGGRDINKGINTSTTHTGPEAAYLTTTTAVTAATTATTAAATASATIVRPKPKAPFHNAQHQQQPPEPTAFTPDTTTQPAIVRRISNASVTIRHPVPDLNARSGACLGNIATLEATAERLSTSSSIESAIRDAHDELKRSDSQRSSILRAKRASVAASEASETSEPPQRPVLSRQSSILGTNNAARLGGYSPAGYVMSPNPSLSNASTRLRSGSKASSLGVPAPAAGIIDHSSLSTDADNGDGFSFMSRHGPGKGSVRSVVSTHHPLPEIAEMEPPMTLTQDALDDADRVAAAGEDTDDEDDTIRASEQQNIYTGSGMGTGTGTDGAGIAADIDENVDKVVQPMLQNDPMDLPSPNRLQLHHPDSYVHYGSYDVPDGRPATSGSCTTFDQAQTAFGDFDGVHCDPSVLDFPEPIAREPPKRASQMPRAAPPRPTSYIDTETGQHMLFYPARVPAMLNLPPKLSKNSGLAARRKVRSQVLSVMPTESRESRVWLPDPLEGLGAMDAPLMGADGADDHGPTDQLPEGGISPPAFDPELGQLAAGHSRHPSETGTVVPPGHQERKNERQSRLAENDNRKSRMPGPEDLAPHLRASVFFDRPGEAPVIEVKDGSATATLDSILDASAGAPVSAFTDHTYAGKLGAEVYGREKKMMKKAREAMTAGHRRANSKNSTLTTLTVSEPKKRASFLSLMVGSRRSETPDADRRKSALGVAGEGDIRRDSSDSTSPTPDQPATSSDQRYSHEGETPGDEDEDKDEDEDEDEDAEGEDQYEGPPTTLLAELQLRKQQQKLRTRPVHKVYPNGLHSTLLDLDTVAEVERKARKSKKINLAWEDPTANRDAMEDEEDDDVPLGMLYAAKAAAAGKGGNISSMDISAVMGEIHRPLGLMERRDMEENEPLSRRRDRLQGRDPGSMANLGVLQQRMSMMALTPGGLGARTQSRLNLPLQLPQSPSVSGDDGPDEPEVEGETLAERKRRLNPESLPRARPVSGAFSAELLSQFDGFDEEDNTGGDVEGKGKEKPSARSPGQSNEVAPVNDAEVPEEEETLGQRRRRIQAEREAREREMGGATGIPPFRTGTPLGLDRTGTPLSLNPNMNGSHSRIPSFSGDPTAETNRLSRPLSMANILSAHPLEAPQGLLDPRAQERQRVEAAATRAQWDRDANIAAMRAQMPQTLHGAAGNAAKGGYMSGRFNDGLGGGMGYGLQQQQQQQQQQMPLYAGNPGYGGAGLNPPGSTYGMGMNGAPYGGGVPMGSVYGMNSTNGVGGMSMPMQMQMQTQMQTPPTQGHLDRVERWRQGVMP